MKRIKKTLDIVFDKNKNDDWDTWHAIVADEGKGKTHLALHILEYWTEKKLGTIDLDYFKHFNLNKNAWKRDLSNLKKLDISIYDEAGELNNRRFMSKFNVDITQFSRIIRGNNNYVILNIQDLFDLDPFFVKRRLKGMFFIYKRGWVAYWSQKRLRALVAYNKPIPIKNIWAVAPSYYDRFPIYNGVFKDKYLEMKEEFMKKQQESLKEDKDKKKSITNPDIFKAQGMREAGLKTKDIALKLDCHINTIYKYLNTST